MPSSTCFCFVLCITQCFLVPFNPFLEEIIIQEKMAKTPVKYIFFILFPTQRSENTQMMASARQSINQLKLSVFSEIWWLAWRQETGGEICTIFAQQQQQRGNCNREMWQGDSQNTICINILNTRHDCKLKSCFTNIQYQY